jgi:hypothetical protein
MYRLCGQDNRETKQLHHHQLALADARAPSKKFTFFDGKGKNALQIEYL